MKSSILFLSVILILLIYLPTANAATKSRPIESCNEFVQRWLDGYEYARSYYQYECSSTTQDGATFVIHGKPGTINNDYWFYLPDKDVVIWVDRNNQQKLMNSKTFTDISEKLTTMNSDGDIEFKKLPADQKPRVCESVTSIYSSLPQMPWFWAGAGELATKAARNGNWSFFGTRYSGETCFAIIDVAGTVEGSSVQKRVLCTINGVQKGSGGKGSYHANFVGTEGGCRSF